MNGAKNHEDQHVFCLEPEFEIEQARYVEGHVGSLPK